MINKEKTETDIKTVEDYIKIIGTSPKIEIIN
jgi:hypothetical protein